MSTGSEENVEVTTAATDDVRGDTADVDGRAEPSNDPSREPPFTHTRASGVWAAVVVALVVLVVLLVFILENGKEVRLTFFGLHGRLPLGIAMLFAAITGAFVVVMAGTARILELRSRSLREARQGRRLRRRHTTGPTE